MTNGAIPKEPMPPITFADLVNAHTEAEQRARTAITRLVLFAVALGCVVGAAVTWMVIL